jgi:hypothetical protein
VATNSHLHEQALGITFPNGGILEDQSQEIRKLIDNFDHQLEQALATLERIRANPNEPHPMYAEMYQRLAWDPESLRAALEAELRRRGLHRDLRYMSTAALSIMFEVYVSFVKGEGGGQIDSDGGLSLSILDFQYRSGLME